MKELSVAGRILIGVFTIFNIVFLAFTWGILPNEWMYESHSNCSRKLDVQEKNGIIVSKDCKKVCSCTFSGMKYITSVRFENESTKIAKKTFFDCRSLSYIRLPDNIDEIYPFTFAFCEDLSEICLPKKLSKIDEGAFFNCKELECIKICSSNIDIEASAFVNCKKLTSIMIPCADIHITVAKDAFYGLKKQVVLKYFTDELVSKNDLMKILNEKDLSRFQWLKIEEIENEEKK